MFELKEYIQVDQGTVTNIIPFSAFEKNTEDAAYPSRFLGAIIQITSKLLSKRECVAL